MNEAAFWAIMDGSRERSDGDLHAQVVLVEESLGQLSDEDLLSFDRCFIAANAELYTEEVLDAATFIFGYLGDDTFTDFRSWVVAQGSEFHRQVRTDPDALAEVPFEDEEVLGDVERLQYLARETYEVRTGVHPSELAEHPDLGTSGPPRGARLPAGRPDLLLARFPRLHRLYGERGLRGEPIEPRPLQR